MKNDNLETNGMSQNSKGDVFHRIIWINTVQQKYNMNYIYTLQFSGNHIKKEVKLIYILFNPKYSKYYYFNMQLVL